MEECRRRVFDDARYPRCEVASMAASGSPPHLDRCPLDLRRKHPHQPEGKRHPLPFSLPSLKSAEQIAESPPSLPSLPSLLVFLSPLHSPPRTCLFLTTQRAGILFGRGCAPFPFTFSFPLPLNGESRNLLETGWEPPPRLSSNIISPTILRTQGLAPLQFGFRGKMVDHLRCVRTFYRILMKTAIIHDRHPALKGILALQVSTILPPSKRRRLSRRHPRVKESWRSAVPLAHMCIRLAASTHSRDRAKMLLNPGDPLMAGRGEEMCVPCGTKERGGRRCDGPQLPAAHLQCTLACTPCSPPEEPLAFSSA